MIDTFLPRQTGVWDILDSLCDQFLSPLRSLLAETRARCRSELQLRRDEAKSSKQGGGVQREDPQVTVEIPNDSSLPTPSLREEIEVCDFCAKCVLYLL